MPRETTADISAPTFTLIMIIVIWAMVNLFLLILKFLLSLRNYSEHRPKVRRCVAAIVETVIDTESTAGGGGGCVICLEEYKHGEIRAAVGACNHKYHAVCIKAWLLDHDTCPLCRTHLV